MLDYLVDVNSMQGCGCNQRFLNLAAAFGHPHAEIIAGTTSPLSFDFCTSTLQTLHTASLLCTKNGSIQLIKDSDLLRWPVWACRLTFCA